LTIKTTTGGAVNAINLCSSCSLEEECCAEEEEEERKL